MFEFVPDLEGKARAIKTYTLILEYRFQANNFLSLLDTTG